MLCRAVLMCCYSTPPTTQQVSYTRKAFGQTGDGHFSPIGGYHGARDLVLILDTVRMMLCCWCCSWVWTLCKQLCVCGFNSHLCRTSAPPSCHIASPAFLPFPPCPCPPTGSLQVPSSLGAPPNAVRGNGRSRPNHWPTAWLPAAVCQCTARQRAVHARCEARQQLEAGRGFHSDHCTAACAGAALWWVVCVQRGWLCMCVRQLCDPSIAATNHTAPLCLIFQPSLPPKAAAASGQATPEDLLQQLVALAPLDSVPSFIAMRFAAQSCARDRCVPHTVRQQVLRELRATPLHQVRVCVCLCGVQCVLLLMLRGIAIPVDGGDYSGHGW